VADGSKRTETNTHLPLPEKKERGGEKKKEHFGRNEKKKDSKSQSTHAELQRRESSVNRFSRRA
jgi:hypothetical protein